ncbi:hypothetical protein K438DRAFT_676096 [Mycena galopus ATCC 62051]|nr:hypothetical protein K438DRAFT_676096 [Mycena galopus ATCC 62051]
MCLEWLQLPIALTSGASSRAPDVYCDLFIPSLGVFGISETVPFHLQLSRATHPLRDLFFSPPSSGIQETHNPILRVSLLRHITVDITGQRMNTTFEEYSLRPVPPRICLYSSRSDDVLNWEGEIQLQDIAAPSFDIGILKLRYLIAVELSPPKTSPIKRAHYGYPIKLTTNTWAGSAELDTEQHVYSCVHKCAK